MIEEVHDNRKGFGYRLSDRVTGFIRAMVLDRVADTIKVIQRGAIDLEPKIFEPIAKRSEVDSLIGRRLITHPTVSIRDRLVTSA
jgi:hypothetical protein